MTTQTKHVSLKWDPIPVLWSSTRTADSGTVAHAIDPGTVLHKSGSNPYSPTFTPGPGFWPSKGPTLVTTQTKHVPLKWDPIPVPWLDDAIHSILDWIAPVEHAHH